jgi:hypothetical protein
VTKVIVVDTGANGFSSLQDAQYLLHPAVQSAFPVALEMRRTCPMQGYGTAAQYWFGIVKTAPPGHKQ